MLLSADMNISLPLIYSHGWASISASSASKDSILALRERRRIKKFLFHLPLVTSATCSRH